MRVSEVLLNGRIDFKSVGGSFYSVCKDPSNLLTIKKNNPDTGELSEYGIANSLLFNNLPNGNHNIVLIGFRGCTDLYCDHKHSKHKFLQIPIDIEKGVLNVLGSLSIKECPEYCNER